MSGHEFYDYAAKYTPGLSETSTRAEVTDRERATHAASSRATPTGRSAAKGFARVDFLVAGETIYLSEINTIPGFTPISLFPTMPAEGGYTFAARLQPDRRARARAARGAGRPAADARGPAAMSGRPVARRTRAAAPRRAGHARSGAPRRACRRSAPGPRSRCSPRRPRSTASAPRRPSTTRRLQVDGAAFTDAAAVEAALADVRGENLFRLSTGPLEAALETLPTVESARVDVALPGTLVVTIEEREPVLVWQVGARRYLADADGDLFAPAGRRSAGRRGRAAGHRRPPGGLGRPVGRARGSTRSTSTRRPGSPRSSRPTSAARPSALAVGVTDENGFVLGPSRTAGSAVFGFYTPSLRTTELIPGQVRLLRSLLVGREPLVDRVILASETDGTYIAAGRPRRRARARRRDAAP